MQQGRLRDPLGGDRPLAGKQLRMADRHRFLVEQRVGSATRIVGFAVVDGGVVWRAVEQEHIRLRAEVDHHLGMLRVEGGQARNQPFHCQRRHAGQFHDTARALVRHDIQRVALQLLQAFPHLIAIQRAGRGQADALVGAVEQRHAELALQRGDLARDGALAQAELRRRPAQVLVAGGGFESAQAAEAGNAGGAHGASGRGAVDLGIALVAHIDAWKSSSYA